LHTLLELDVLVPEGVALKVEADEVSAALEESILSASSNKSRKGKGREGLSLQRGYWISMRLAPLTSKCLEDARKNLMRCKMYGGNEAAQEAAGFGSGSDLNTHRQRAKSLLLAMG
jgi:hypothetical protein